MLRDPELTSAAQLLSNIDFTIANWSLSPSSDSYASLVSFRAEIDSYRSTHKPEWNSERMDLEDLLLNIQTKLKTYGLRSYDPEEAYSTAVSPLLRSVACRS